MKNPIPIASKLALASAAKLALASAAMLAAPAAWAHPDHTGSAHFEVGHYVLDPFHASWLIGVVALAAIAWRLRARAAHSVARRSTSRSA